MGASLAEWLASGRAHRPPRAAGQRWLADQIIGWHSLPRNQSDELMITAAAKQLAFAQLAGEAAACRLCPAMCERTAVLSALNGPVDARVLFIGEAPGRKGADRTRIPFSGDQSGVNLDRYLASINLKRDSVFITSAALC